MIKIALDIGHGIDTYPPNKGIGDFAEFEFNNAVVKLAKPLAELNGFEVYLPQPFDSQEVDLNTRCKNIRANKCKLVISTHANAGSPLAHGREVWYWQDDLKAKRLASLWLNNSSSLGNSNRGAKISSYIKGQNFGMLRNNSSYGIPAIITESAFFTNKHERENLLKNDDFLLECAVATVKTACDYFGVQFVQKVKQEGNSWSIDARKWAKKNKISDCTRLNESATREEVITMLYNYSRYQDE